MLVLVHFKVKRGFSTSNFVTVILTLQCFTITRHFAGAPGAGAPQQKGGGASRQRGGGARQ